MSVGNIANSGLKAALTNMEAISNNIANVNTIGFKKTMINFSDIYAGSGLGGQSTGLGTRVQSISQDFSTGRVESSSRGLDLRLANDGFFVQKNISTGLVSYTRAGRMDFDSDGYLTGMAGKIQGYPAVNGKVQETGTLVDLKITNTAIPASATKTAELSLNLDSNASVIAASFDANDPATYNYRSDETIYDSLGNSYLMSMYYVKTSDNTWNTQVAVDNSIVSSGTLNFSDVGTLSSATGITGLNWSPGNGALAPQSLDIRLAGSTQFAGQNKVYDHRQDGLTSGQALGATVDNDGKINVYYSNGMSRVEGQIAVAKFHSVNGLSQTDTMSWLATADSGPAMISGDQSKDSIISSSIEYSNVDLTEELVKLISAQHDFQANAQVQQTYNQVLQTVEKL